MSNSRPLLLNRSLSISAGWLIVGLVLALEWLLFSQWALREIAWAYPGMFDQTVYLAHSYSTFEYMRAHGMVAGFWHGLATGLPQGNLLHSEAAAYYFLAGPSRLSALTVVWIHWAAFQVAAVGTVRWRTQSWSLAFLTLGLILTSHSRFPQGGGMWDFRLDFPAACLYGVVLCAIIRSGYFESRAWSIGAGVLAGILILCRHLTALSVLPLLGLATAVSALGAFLTRSVPTAASEWTRRTLNAAAAVAAGFLLPAPILWADRAQILAYYGSHVTTDEGAVRRAEFAAETFRERIVYYPRSIVGDHLGVLCTCLLIVVVAIAMLRLRRTLTATPPLLPKATWIPAVISIGAAVIPFCVLSLVPTRSPVVAGFLVPAIIGAAVTLLSRAVLLGGGSRFALAVNATATMCLAAGLATEVTFAARPGPMSARKDEVAAMTVLVDAVGQASLHATTPPTLGIDRIFEFMHVGLFQPWYYERHGVLLDLQPILGGGVLAPPDAQILASARASDLLILTDPTSPDVGFSYPSNLAFKRLYPQLAQLATLEFLPIAAATVSGQRMTAYVRLPLLIDGVSGGWITSQGFSLRLNGIALRQHQIEIAGAHPLVRYFTEPLHATVRVSVDGRTIESTSTFSAPGPEYRLVVRVAPGEMSADADVRVRVTFDAFIVPKSVGLNDDQRELVVMMPTHVQIGGGLTGSADLGSEPRTPRGTIAP